MSSLPGRGLHLGLEGGAAGQPPGGRSSGSEKVNSRRPRPASLPEPGGIRIRGVTAGGRGDTSSQVAVTRHPLSCPFTHTHTAGGLPRLLPPACSAVHTEATVRPHDLAA